MAFMKNIYAGDYKRYLIIPAILWIIFLAMIFVFPTVKPGIDLKGGTSLIVRADKELNADDLKSVLEEKYPLGELQVSSVSSPAGYGLYIQYSENTELGKAKSLLDQASNIIDSNPEQAKALAIESLAISGKFTSVSDISSFEPLKALDSARASYDDARDSFRADLQSTITETFGLGETSRFQSREVGPSLGENFFLTGITVAFVAFLLVAIVIFIFFREIFPTAAIILSILFDVSGALALMALFQIPLSLSTITALLMLIGYSVDTDLMLTTRLLKRKEGDTRERAYGSMVTGLTMTSTTLVALVVMLILSYFGQLQVIFEISAVLLFGLFADIPSTWLMNAPLLLDYVDKKEASR